MKQIKTGLNIIEVKISYIVMNEYINIKSIKFLNFRERCVWIFSNFCKRMWKGMPIPENTFLDYFLSNKKLQLICENNGQDIHNWHGIVVTGDKPTNWESQVTQPYSRHGRSNFLHEKFWEITGISISI